MRKSNLSIAISNFAKNAENANTLYFDYMNIKDSLTEALASAFENFREVLTEILTNGDKGNQWQDVVIILQKMHENNQKQFIRAKTPDNRGLKRLIHSKDLSIKIFPNDEQRLEHLAIVENLINPFTELTKSQKEEKEKAKNKAKSSFWELYKKDVKAVLAKAKKSDYVGMSDLVKEGLESLALFLDLRIAQDKESGESEE